MTGPRVGQISDGSLNRLPRTKFGNVELTDRQIDICILVTQGCKNIEIAGHLKTSDSVVKHWICEIFDLTGMSTRLELAVWTMKWIVMPKPDQV
jgi:DNA-binding NarL/FixJ family response regulator